MENIAIIVGAGTGERFGSFKQIQLIHGKAVYKYSLEAFISSKIFSQIFLVLHQELINTIKKEIKMMMPKELKMSSSISLKIKPFITDHFVGLRKTSIIIIK